MASLQGVSGFSEWSLNSKVITQLFTSGTQSVRVCGNMYHRMDIHPESTQPDRLVLRSIPATMTFIPQYSNGETCLPQVSSWVLDMSKT